MKQEELINSAIKIAKKFIRPQEHLELRAYPDSSSPMSKALSAMNKLALYKAGKFELTKDLLKLDPEPISIGYGQTGNIKLGDTCTLEEAEAWLDTQIKVRVMDVLKAAPKLLEHSPEKLAACVSLQYNVGKTAFAGSTLVKLINKDDMIGAAGEFAKWNKDNGVVVQGLVNRRAQEAALFRSVES